MDRASFSGSSTALLAIPYSVTPGESHNFDLTTSSYAVSSGSNVDPAYLFTQIKSAEWINRHGLKSQRLTFDQILQQIGFKRVESFDPVIGKTVTAKYAGNLYHEVQHDNGDRYVLTCRPEKLREFHHRLTRMLNLLRKRLLFITNGSRRLFGVIGEPSVCLVCDCKTMDHRTFNQFQVSLTNLFKEQISKIKKFNIVWVSNDNEQFREQPIDVNATNIDHAIDWICDRKCPRSSISISATCEAVLKAFNNDVQGIYLISEGDSSDLAREMLRDNIVKTRLSSTSSVPLHVISLFCNNNDTQLFLRSLAQSADGSYFCYKIKNEFADLKAPSNLNDPTRIKLQGDKFQMGTNALTPLPEYPLDLTIMYREIFECQNVIDRLEKILGFIRDETQSPSKSIEPTKSTEAFNTSGEHNFQRSLVVQSSALFSNEENEMSSADWLKLHGIDCQKLDFFSVLQSAAFRHCDGVVTLLKPPYESDEKAPANPQDKLINAIYCDQFAHVAWPDGTIRHVHVTPELYRDYERRVKAVLEKIRARLAWLTKGSREVFGSILENNIYLLIDTSQSMQHHLNFVKEKLRLLIQDQLNTKERVNLVAFNSIVTPWRDRLTKLNDTTTYSQLQPWIDALHAEGSTNTLAALRFALADPATEAIYLLTDGRPDQSERHILSQVQYRQTIPIHTIAFNCNDQVANRFLIDLAKQTGGRFHTFSYGFQKQSAVEIPESEDVGSLKQELIRGEKELERIANLRDECLGKAWSGENLQAKLKKYKSQQSHNDAKSLPSSQHKSQSSLDIPLRPNSASMSARIAKKKRSTTNKNRQRRSKSATNLASHSAVINYNPDTWLLPEVKEFLKIENDTQEKQSDAETLDKVETKPPKRKHVRTPYNEVVSYLKRNSLVVQGLTIFDVLQPTSVTVKDPRYIQVIDRYVLAKVWDDILPLVYGSYVGKFHLVNHYAVDLEKYEVKLKDLIDKYHQFVTNYVWKHLSDDIKRKLGPSLHWSTLSKEEQTKLTQEIDKEAYTSQSALEHFAWLKLTDQEQNALLEKPVPYEDKNQALLKNALQGDENESALKGTARMDVEIQRAIKFVQISTDLRLLQKRVETDAKTVEPKPTVKRKTSGESNIHQRVICRFDPDGFFHPGTIQKHPDGQSMVRFDMGMEQEAVGHIILPTKGAIAQPHIYVNDCVLVRQMNGNQEYWAPGIVLVLPSSVAQPPPLYMVQIYNPSSVSVHVVRRDILKISLGLYQRTVLYLQNLYHKTRRLDSSPTNNKVPSNESLKSTLRNELGPLANKVEDLRDTQNQCYNQLKTVLNDHMDAIKDLQEKASNKAVRPSAYTTQQISLKPTQDRSVSPIVIENLSDRKKPESPKPDLPKPSPQITPSPPPIPRRAIDYIEPDTPVYALWLDDDRFVYEGIVECKEDDSNSYRVKRSDTPTLKSIIPRRDIFLESECKRIKELKPESFALIQHPKNSLNSWKPAVILHFNDEKRKTHVRLYTCENLYLSNNENVIPIDAEKFEIYAKHRIEFENSLVGKKVVGFNSEKKTFMSGRVIRRGAYGDKYHIKWRDAEENEENEETYLFGTFTKRIANEEGNLVLTMDVDEHCYKLAEVIRISNDKKQLTVRFKNPKNKKKEANVKTSAAHVMTQTKYNLILEKLSA